MTNDTQDDTDESGRTNSATVKRRDVIAGLGAAGVFAAAASGQSQDSVGATIGGGPMSSEVSHLQIEWAEGEFSERPDAGVENRYFRVEDESDDRHGNIYRDDGSSWGLVDVGFGALNAEEVANTGRDYSQLKTVTDDGAWTWFQEPRAVGPNHDNVTTNKTFVGWINNENGDIVAGSYDHDTDAVTTNTVASGFERDDHDNPTILVRSDGTIWVTYSEHGDPTGVRYHVSDSPEDITSFGSQQTVSTTTPVTYMSPVEFSDDEIRIYHRGSFANGGNWGYVSTTDSGSTWSDTGVFDGNNYNKVHQDGDVVHFGVTTDGAHPRSSETGISHLKYDHSTGTYSDAAGNTYSTPVDTSTLPNVWDYDDDGSRAWIWDIAVANDGNPVLLFAVFEEEWYQHGYYHAKWDGSDWQVNKITDGGSYIPVNSREKQYSQGLYFDHSDPSTVFAAVGDARASKLQRWDTSDGGSTWSYTDIAGAQQSNIRPFVPRGYHSDMRVLWLRGDYRHYANGGYETSIVYSDSKPTASVDLPNITKRFDWDTKVTRSSTQSVPGDDDYINVDFENREYGQPEIWESGQDKAYSLYPPDWGFYTVTASIEFESVSAAGTYVIEEFKSGDILDSVSASSGETVRLSGSTDIKTRPAPDKASPKSVIRVRQDSGSPQDITSARATISIHGP